MAALLPARLRRGAHAMGSAIAVAALCIGGAGETAAQGTHSLRVEVAASHARPPAGVVASAASYLTGSIDWLYAGRIVAFGGVGAGVPATSGDGWLSAYGGTRLERPLRAALTAGVNAYAMGFGLDRADEYRVAAVRVEPDLRLGTGATQLSVRLHGAVAAARTSDAGETVSTQLWSAGGAVEVERAVGRARVGVGGAAYETANGTFYNAGGSVDLRFGDARASLGGRAWFVPVTGATGAVQLRVEAPFTRVFRGVAAGGRSDPDPLLDVRPGTYASAGVALDVLAAVRPPPPTTTEVLAGRGLVRFTVLPGDLAAVGGGDDDAANIEVLGDFTAWEPVALIEAERGVYTVDVPVAPGVYHFVFRVGGRFWLPENAAGRTEDEWGRPTAILVVPRE